MADDGSQQQQRQQQIEKAAEREHPNARGNELLSREHSDEVAAKIRRV